MHAMAGRCWRRWRPFDVLPAAVCGASLFVAALGAAQLPHGVAADGVSLAAGAIGGRLSKVAVAHSPTRALDGHPVLPAAVMEEVAKMLDPGSRFGAAVLDGPRRSLLSSQAAPFRGDEGVAPVERRAAGKVFGVGSERTNLTLVLQDVEVGPDIYDAKHWMFAHSKSPFTYSSNNLTGSFFANRHFSWNSDGRGTGVCAASSRGKPPPGRHPTEGSGRVSHGHVDDATVSLGLPLAQLPVSWAKVHVSIDGFELETFRHMNMRSGSTAGRDWAVMGAAGDQRTYQNGSVDVWEEGGSFLLSAHDVKWVQNTSYPSPFGPGDSRSYQIGAYLLGRYNASRTSAAWASRLDPDGYGIFLAVLQSVAMTKPGCYASNNYWFTVRPLPSAAITALATATAPGDSAVSGDVLDIPAYRRGRTIASSEKAVAASQAMGSAAAAGTMGLAGAGAVLALGGAAIGVAGGSLSAGPGQGIVHAVTAAAFMAQLRQVNTFHSDAFETFSSSFDGFLLRDKKAPWDKGGQSSSARYAVPLAGDYLSRTVRQSADAADQAPERNTIAHDLFVGCAFHASIIVGVALLIHALVAAFTWRKPTEVQLNSHKWMVYLLALALTYIFPAAVLNSLQYLLSNVPAGTGHPVLYVVAGLQLSIIGIGYSLFFILIIAYAIHQQRLKRVRWVKREDAPDPLVRQDRFISGVYEADGEVPVAGAADDSVLGLDDAPLGSVATSGTSRGRRSRRLHAFHELFACYYDFLRGPLVWLAALEMIVILSDCIFVATIESEVLVLSLMLGVHAGLFALFLFLSPFTDKIEGVFFTLVTVLELLMIMMEFASIYSADPLAEQLNLTLVVLGFVTMGLVILCAVWTDAYPMLCIVGEATWAKFTDWRHGSRASSRDTLSTAPAHHNHPHTIVGACRECEEASGQLNVHAAAAASAKGFGGHTCSSSSGAGGSSPPNTAAFSGVPTAMVRSSSNRSGASSWSGLASTTADDVEQQALVSDVPEPAVARPI
eukprot:TRINITY_DN5451_c0_g1_i1.p1 TRINITY_DN5451_c0_g1~~TRINITY_DN5451_c0_g1_i1.p1  ORF type:complete len:1003 (-),score=303.03 TRINITY_DN5451_c0_g1_i1:319-3327(-)